MPVFFSQKSFGRQKIKHNKNRKKYLEKETLLMEKLSVEELEELREKEFDERAERAERIQTQYHCLEKLPAFWR